MNYYIEIQSNKPKEDINQIVESMGYRNIVSTIHGSGAIMRFITKIWAMIAILIRMKKNDILLIQYPMKKFYTPACICTHLKGGKVITLIHDLGSFRRKKLTAKQENKRLSHSDYIIVHNESMKKFLEENGCKVPLHCLELFDYISPASPAQYPTPHQPYKIVYAGGLSPKRNPFLYQLDTHIHNWSMELYGKDFDAIKAKEWKNIHFHGLLHPDKLLETVQGDFGLVWDGNSLDECSGNWGEYLRFNNPHKTSFYLRGNIPVIIWEKAALAPFIKKHRIGFCIDSLKDLNDNLAKLTQGEYMEMKRNAEEIGNKVSKGFFTQQALKTAEIYLKNR